MSKSSNTNALSSLIGPLMKNPWFLGIAIIIALVLWFTSRDEKPSPHPSGPAQGYTFCWWNLGNLFDDVDSPLNRDDDENWMGNAPEIVKLKVQRLAEALLKMNDGKGPDIIATCEVENEAAAVALQTELNRLLDADGRADQKYLKPVFVEDKTGRRIAPMIMSRIEGIQFQPRRTKSAGESRILVATLTVNNHQLTMIAAHWTSRVTDETGERRMEYAQKCYAELKAALKDDPDADVILCGDFNDEHKDKSIQEGIKATDNPETTKTSAEPNPLNLCTLITTEPKATLFYGNKGQIFDHVCVSKGLLDEKGWHYIPDTIRIYTEGIRTSKGHPWTFGHEKHKGERGYSDHFPVLMQIGVQGNTP